MFCAICSVWFSGYRDPTRPRPLWALASAVVSASRPLLALASVVVSASRPLWAFGLLLCLPARPLWAFVSAVVSASPSAAVGGCLVTAEAGHSSDSRGGRRQTIQVWPFRGTLHPLLQTGSIGMSLLRL